jgi:hypothetical protein
MRHCCCAGSRRRSSPPSSRATLVRSRRPAAPRRRRSGAGRATAPVMPPVFSRLGRRRGRGGTLGRWIMSAAIVAGAAGDRVGGRCAGPREPPPLAGQIDGGWVCSRPRSLASSGRAPRDSPGEPGRIAGAACLVARLGYMAGVFLDHVLGRPHDASAVQNGTMPIEVAILLQAIALRRDGEVPGRASGAAGGGRRSLARSCSRNTLAQVRVRHSVALAARLDRMRCPRAPSVEPRTLSS